MSKVNKRIGLDIDGVLCNFMGGVIARAEKLGLSEHFPNCCHDVQHWDISDKFQDVMKDAWAGGDFEFWKNLQPLVDSIPFTPTCYITARSVPVEVTKAWLDKHGFPEAEVITTKTPDAKLQHVVEQKLDVFVDDYYYTVQMLLDAGCNAVLYEQPYQIGHIEDCKDLPKIRSLDELC